MAAQQSSPKDLPPFKDLPEYFWRIELIKRVPFPPGYSTWRIRIQDCCTLKEAERVYNAVLLQEGDSKSCFQKKIEGNYPQFV